MISALRRPSLIAFVCAVVALTGACSGGNEPESPEVTTGTLPRLGSTTTIDPATASSLPEEGDEPAVGLWIVTPGGITDENGDRYVRPNAGESLRNPVDDGAGGVFYLRCVETTLNCSIEHVVERSGDPTVVGEASSLIARGTIDDHPVMLTEWNDASRVPSFEDDVSSLVMRIIDLSDNSVESTHEWLGWESGPFVADVEGGQYMACFGEGETCGMMLKATADDLGTPVETDAESAVTSGGLSSDGSVLYWLDVKIMDGSITATALDIASGKIDAIDVRDSAEPAVNESVIDGQWVALRLEETVEVYDLAANPDEPIVFEVSSSATEMAIRPPFDGGGGASSVL